MPAGKEYQIIGVEGEVWGGPAEGVEEFGGFGHLVVRINCRFGCALLDSQLSAEVEEGMDMIGTECCAAHK